MKYQKFGNVYVVRIDRGEEIVAQLKELAAKEDIRLAKVDGLGAADRVTAGLYDVEQQKFCSQTIDKPLEITALVGNITRQAGEPYLHLHITVVDSGLIAYGGHLQEARVSGTCELFVTVLDGEVGRREDDITGTGLNLLDF